MKEHSTLDKIRKENKVQTIHLLGLNIIVLKKVFSPVHFRASRWFAKKISRIVRKKSLLEIGTGTGAIALKCAKNGAKVVATDINSIAVKNAKLNAKINKLDIDIRKSDVYSNIKKSEKFDFIFWNHPFDDRPRKLKDELSKSVYDPLYKNTEKFIRQSKFYLKKNGRLLLGTGTDANFERLGKIAKKNKMKIKELNRHIFPRKPEQKLKFGVVLLEFT